MKSAEDLLEGIRMMSGDTKGRTLENGSDAPHTSNSDGVLDTEVKQSAAMSLDKQPATPSTSATEATESRLIADESEGVRVETA